MQVGALGPYEQSLLTASPLCLHDTGGRVTSLDVARYLGAVDDADRSVLARCVGPTLDVGCGPGRFVAALTERGVVALGVDIAETAITLTRDRGLRAVLRSVFAPIPAEGHWRTVLLMDGNIGIGGDPALLLARVHALLAPGGQVLIETHADPDADEMLTVRFSQHGEVIGPSFPWAYVGVGPLLGYARELGYGAPEVWSAAGRTYVSLPR
jgi:SAM-dependent methyltransferase